MKRKCSCGGAGKLQLPPPKGKILKKLAHSLKGGIVRFEDKGRPPLFIASKPTWGGRRKWKRARAKFLKA